jgi:Family of unknown function (DUF6065)
LHAIFARDVFLDAMVTAHLRGMAMQLFKGWPAAPDPARPKSDIRGEIPARAVKFCEPFLAANSAGWLLYPPVEFCLEWTGAEVLLNFSDVEETILLDRVFIPDFNEYWLRNVEPINAEVMPPFLEAFPERGVVQIWSGFFVVTDPGISTWVRSPVNRTNSSGYSVIEGIVETDWWIGPLFFPVQINKTDYPVKFSKDTPFLQIVPFDRNAAAKAESRDKSLLGLSDLTDDLWTRLRENAVRRNTEPPGSYRREARRRARASGASGDGSDHQ